MKAEEVKNYIKPYSIEELQMLVVEIYKRVPVRKREEYDLDSLILNPKGKIEKDANKGKEKFTIKELEKEVEEFDKNVRRGEYINKSTIIPKVEQGKWRYKVMGFVKELRKNFKDADEELIAIQSLNTLYELMIHCCREYLIDYKDDTFTTIKVEQEDFFEIIILKLKKILTPERFLDNAMELLLENKTNGNISLRTISKKLLPHLEDEKMLRYALNRTLQKIEKHTHSFSSKGDRSSSGNFHFEYYHNYFVEFAFDLLIELQEPEEAATFFIENYKDRDNEITLYVLCSNLLGKKEAKLIQKTIEEAIEKGVKPRKGLLDLLEQAKVGVLPRYINHR